MIDEELDDAGKVAAAIAHLRALWDADLWADDTDEAVGILLPVLDAALAHGATIAAQQQEIARLMATRTTCEHCGSLGGDLVNATLERAATGLDTVRHAHSEGGCIHCRAVSECQAAIRALKATEEQ